MNFQRYIGRTIEIIYIDRTGKITQRRIVIRSVHGVIRAYCIRSGALRTFRVENILAVQVVTGHAG